MRSLLLLLASLIAQPLCFAAQPNVIYLMADELGYYEPGFMGGVNIQTPNLDKMAKEGMRFKNLFAGSAVCAPTRCCFLRRIPIRRRRLDCQLHQCHYCKQPHQYNNIVGRW